MRFHQSLFLAATLVSSAYSRVLDTRQTSLDTWVSQEELSARFGLFRNIGSQGEFAHSVNPGAVIASPSTSSPD